MTRSAEVLPHEWIAARVETVAPSSSAAFAAVGARIGSLVPPSPEARIRKEIARPRWRTSRTSKRGAIPTPDRRWPRPDRPVRCLRRLRPRKRLAHRRFRGPRLGGARQPENLAHGGPTWSTSRPLRKATQMASAAWSHRLVHPAAVPHRHRSRGRGSVRHQWLASERSANSMAKTVAAAAPNEDRLMLT